MIKTRFFKKQKKTFNKLVAKIGREELKKRRENIFNLITEAVIFFMEYYQIPDRKCPKIIINELCNPTYTSRVYGDYSNWSNRVNIYDIHRLTVRRIISVIFHELFHFYQFKIVKTARISGKSLYFKEKRTSWEKIDSSMEMEAIKKSRELYKLFIKSK